MDLLPVEFRIDKKMPIAIERDFYARMPKLVLDVFQILASGYSDAGVRMSQ